MKGTTTFILLLVLIIGVFFMITKTRSGSSSKNYTEVPADNVSVVDGQQIIAIRAKGGYLPKISVAKSGIPTIIRFDSKGTFDCSASVRIPSMKISRSLEFSGTTDIALGIPKAGTLKGTCSMGMYSFEVQFQS